MSILIDSYSETNQGDVSNNYGGGQMSTGQSFYNTNGARLDSAKFYINKLLLPTGNVYAKLYLHAGPYGLGVPNGEALAISDPIDVSTIPSTLTLTTFTFSGANAFIMKANTYYVIQCEFTGGDSLNALQVGRDISTPTHPGNLSYMFTGISWSPLSGLYDTCFYVYGTPVPGNFFRRMFSRPHLFSPGRAR